MLLVQLFSIGNAQAQNNPVSKCLAMGYETGTQEISKCVVVLEKINPNATPDQIKDAIGKSLTQTDVMGHFSSKTRDICAISTVNSGDPIYIPEIQTKGIVSHVAGETGLLTIFGYCRPGMVKVSVEEIEVGEKLNFFFPSGWIRKEVPENIQKLGFNYFAVNSQSNTALRSTVYPIDKRFNFVEFAKKHQLRTANQYEGGFAFSEMKKLSAKENAAFFYEMSGVPKGQTAKSWRLNILTISSKFLVITEFFAGKESDYHAVKNEFFSIASSMSVGGTPLTGQMVTELQRIANDYLLLSQPERQAVKIDSMSTSIAGQDMVPIDGVANPANFKEQKTQLNGNKRALLIGNDSYKSISKLVAAREDARTIAASLSAVGFQVTLKLDLNEKDMKAALRTFAAQVQGGDEVLFFFAGHGVQLGATNYLLPTDIVGDSEAQVRDEAIQLQRVLDDMLERKAKLTLAVIDACRDNPFKTSGRAIGGRGLAPTTAATGQMVIFSAGTGQQALDRLNAADKNKNGLFTRVFVQEMQKPNVSIDRVVKNVRNQVAELAKSVGHEQVPAIYDQVLGDFYFKK